MTQWNGIRRPFAQTEESEADIWQRCARDTKSSCQALITCIRDENASKASSCDCP